MKLVNQSNLSKEEGNSSTELTNNLNIVIQKSDIVYKFFLFDLGDFF